MKNKGPKHLYLPLILAVMLLCICDCSSKSKTSYLPLGERHLAEQQSIRNNNISASLQVHYNRWQGTRYRIGGLSKKGVDCSGFTLLTYKQLFGVTLPRTVRNQVKRGRKVQREDLRAGDLVFFKTGFFQRHVGIYLKEHKFIHASRSKGVTISDLNNRYWQKKYWKAKRL